MRASNWDRGSGSSSGFFGLRRLFPPAFRCRTSSWRITRGSDGRHPVPGIEREDDLRWGRIDKRIQCICIPIRCPAPRRFQVRIEQQLTLLCSPSSSSLRTCPVSISSSLTNSSCAHSADHHNHNSVVPASLLLSIQLFNLSPGHDRPSTRPPLARRRPSSASLKGHDSATADCAS